MPHSWGQEREVRVDDLCEQTFRHHRAAGSRSATSVAADRAFVERRASRANAHPPGPAYRLSAVRTFDMSRENEPPLRSPLRCSAEGVGREGQNSRRAQPLTESVGHLTALGEMGQAIRSTLDLTTM